MPCSFRGLCATGSVVSPAYLQPKWHQIGPSHACYIRCVCSWSHRRVSTLLSAHLGSCRTRTWSMWCGIPSRPGPPGILFRFCSAMKNASKWVVRWPPATISSPPQGLNRTPLETGNEWMQMDINVLMDASRIQRIEIRQQNWNH